MIFAFIFFSLVWFGLLFSLGSISSGYHLVDDHEAINISYSFQTGATWMSEVQNFIHRDFFGIVRFRPMYAILRVSEIQLFAANFFAWSLLTGFLAVLTSTFLFGFAKKIGGNLIESLIFPAIILFGQQAAVWWRLGPNETPGMFFLAISLFLLGIIYENGEEGKKRTLVIIFFTISAILMSLCKESFVFFLPALILLFYYFSNHKIIKGIRKNSLRTWLPILLLATVFVVEACLIQYMMKLGHASGGGRHIIGVISALYIIFQQANFSLFFVLIFLIGILFDLKSADLLIDRVKGSLKILALPTVALFLIIIPQTLLYASGIFERYFLPSTVGLGIFVLFGLMYIRKSKISFWIYALLIILCLYTSFQQLFLTAQGARIFAKAGEEASLVTSSVGKLSQGETILVVRDDNGDSVEPAYSFVTYFDKIQNRDVVECVMPQKIPLVPENPSIDLDCSVVETKKPVDPKSKNISGVLILNKLGTSFVSASKDWFDTELYSKTTLGQYVFYYKK